MLWISSGIVAYSHLRRADSVMSGTLAQRRGRARAPTLGQVSAPPSPVRLHVVTGKGGTGKTTVAAALALALAADGGSVLLVETEGRQGIAQLFDTAPLPYEERRVAVARGGGEVKALAIDVEEALLDYLDMFYKLRRAGRALRKMGAIDFATTIAPGLRDVLLTGKIKEAVTRRHDGRPVVRRRGRRRAAHRPDHPLPRRHRRDGAAGQAPARSRPRATASWRCCGRRRPRCTW